MAMRFRALRWAGVSLPLLYIVAIELIEEIFLAPQFGRWTGHLIIFAITGIGAVVFTFAVFRVIDRAEAYLQRQNRNLTTLNEISQVASSGLELDKFLSRALTKVMSVTKSDAGEIFLLDDTSHELVLTVHYGLFQGEAGEVDRFHVGEGIPGIVAKTGQAVVVDDLAHDPRCRSTAIVSQGFRAMVSVPLRSKDRVVGVMNAIARHVTYTAADQSLLSAIGNQLGVAVENARLHAQVERQASYLNALIESSGNAIITVSTGGEIVSWNQAAEQIYGWSVEEAIGSVLPMVPDPLREEAFRIAKHVVQSGETVHNFETERRRKNGELIPVMVTVSPVRDGSGAINSILGISTDMREKKRLEHELLQQQKALAAVKERERLARELHDGLGQVLGYVNTQSQAVRELLAQGQKAEVDAHLKRLTEVAQNAHADIREYILGLRATGASEQGFLPALREYLRRFNQYHEIQTRLTVCDEMQEITLGPNVEAQLMRMIQEALTNVRKHAETQDIKIDISLCGDGLAVVVEDAGRGFDPAQVSVQGGRHLGLRLMRERAAEIGASVEVESQPGHGTKVTIQVPLDRENHS